MILGLEIGMLIAGICALVTGKLAFSKNKVVQGPIARVIGLVLLLPVPLAFGAGVLIGLAQSLDGNQAKTKDMEGTAIIAEVAIVLVCCVLALVMGLAFARPSPRERLVDDDQDECEWVSSVPIAEQELAEVLLVNESQDSSEYVPLGIIPEECPPQGRREVPVRKKARAVAVEPKPLSRTILIASMLGGVGLLAVGGVWVLAYVMSRPLKPTGRSGPAVASRQKTRTPESKQARAGEVEHGPKLDVREGDEEWRRRQKELRDEESRRENAVYQEQQRQAAQRVAMEKTLNNERERQDRLALLAKPLADVAIPSPQIDSEVLSVVRNQGDGLTWAILPITGAAPEKTVNRPGISGMPLLAGAVWSADGNSFYAISSAGVLSRVGYPELKVLRKVDFRQECHALAFCKFGLLVTLVQLQELWIVDPETLAVTRRVGISKLVRALTGPSLGVAYAFCPMDDRFGRSGLGILARVDLEDGMIALLTQRLEASKPNVSNQGGFGYVALSPDGKWLFADSVRLFCYRIEDTILTLRDSSRESMGTGHKEGICVSPDNQWVCFPTGGGNDGLNYATYVYRADNLSRPAFSLRQGPYPQVVGYDTNAKRIFSQNHKHPLIVFDENGTKRSEHQFGAISGVHTVKEYAAHPSDGNGLLLRTKDQLLLVQFKNSREK